MWKRKSPIATVIKTQYGDDQSIIKKLQNNVKGSYY
jgi:hypothetical protein